MAIRQRQLSIYLRAMTGVGASLALVTILATFFTIQRDRIALTGDLRDRLATFAEQEAISVGPSLSARDVDGSRTALQHAARDPDFLAATILDGQGQTFLQIGPADLSERPVERSQAPIVVTESGQPRQIGSLLLAFSHDRLQAAQWAAAWKALFLGLLQLVAVLAATALAQRMVAKPLEAITKRMLKVAEGEVAETVPHLERQDQIGDIARAVETFRVKTSKLRTAERAQGRANDDLERRVAKRTEELSVSEERLRGVMDNVTDGIITINEKGIIGSANFAAQNIFGYPANLLLSRHISELIPEPGGAPHDGDEHPWRGNMVGAGAREVVGRRKDGDAIPVELAISEMWLSGEQNYVGVARDITQRKLAERRLQQAQKMEAVGQLTGGIAHDFNNLLTVILGNAEILTKALAGDPQLKPVATLVGNAAQRGADLTRSLLAFSRKLVLQPTVTDVNRLVARMDELLGRTLGEHIEIKFTPRGDLWNTIVDPTQLETAILNLAVNARDAMALGGTLTIELANVELDRLFAEENEGARVGPYVMVSVADTGTGMPPEVLARAFEPFFTTKEVGNGTGIGLSMVYGFIKQSNGYVKISSEAGRGTIVNLYLPRSEQPVRPSLAAVDRTEPVGGGETILVVEDDEMVHTFVTRQIESLGYQVLSAHNGLEALEILRQDASIDLLFTDVVMPGGMDGPELVARASQLRRHLKILYTSGYTENAVARRRNLEPGVELLSKPYLQRDLAAKLRKVLDRAGPP
jgi:PAS domain S-box-containing protein